MINGLVYITSNKPSVKDTLGDLPLLLMPSHIESSVGVAANARHVGGQMDNHRTKNSDGYSSHV